MNTTINLPNIPNVPGLQYRGFRGEEDFPAMAEIWDQMRFAGLVEGSYTAEDLSVEFRHLYNCDPFQDIIFAEINGKAVACARSIWLQEGERKIFYQYFHINPEIQDLGIDLPMQEWLENRQQEISRAIPGEDERVYVQHCAQHDARRVQVLESFGYSAVRWFFSMSRGLDDIPEAELPEGIIVRPAMPGEYHDVWAGANVAFSEHWGFSEPREEDYQSWRESRWFQPTLWQVAWDGDKPIGQVENHIDSVENEKLGRLRGYTEGISVLKPYRGKGIARALIARSLRMLKVLNLQEAALTVDSGNASGALGLYENMGYRTYRTLVEWRKPLPR